MGAALKYGEFELNRVLVQRAPSNDNALRLSWVAQPKCSVTSIRAAARRDVDIDNKLLPRAHSRQASTCKGGVSLPERSEDRRGGGLFNVVGNPVEIRDWRDPADWPDGAKPVTKKIEYDDLYRATRIRYDYAAGDDAWVSPFAAENSGDVGGDASERPNVRSRARMLDLTNAYWNKPFSMICLGIIRRPQMMQMDFMIEA